MAGVTLKRTRVKNQHLSLLSEPSLVVCIVASLFSGGKCSHFSGNLEELVAQDSIECSSCPIGVRIFLYWAAKSAILCYVQVTRIRLTRHRNIRKMAVHKPKISSNSASSCHSLYHIYVSDISFFLFVCIAYGIYGMILLL